MNSPDHEVHMFQLRKGYEVDVRVTFTDNLGKSATIHDVPTWSTGSIAFEIVPASDGLTAVLRGVGGIIGETSILRIDADADLGEGVGPVTMSEDIQLTGGPSIVASFSFGNPRPIAT